MSAAVHSLDSFDFQRDASSEGEVRPSTARSMSEHWHAAGTYADHTVRRSIRLEPSYERRLDATLRHSTYRAEFHRPNPAEALCARHDLLPV